ncbi:MAG: glycosyltransferase family 2 protein [Gammaproteobacteria bacterium]
MTQSRSISIILPAKNEAQNLETLLPQIKNIVPEAEILVVNDGSTDHTAQVAQKFGATVITHPYSMGNGAAVKSAARHASGEILVFLDADGQHNPDDIPLLLQKLGEGYDMVVGARNPKSHASWWRRCANGFYNRFASLMTDHRIEDLTSGFRVVKADKFRKFLYLLPNGFSYPTTSTMAFFRSGFPVGYVPIHAGTRLGKSHIRLLKDGLRFLIIILRIGTLFSPMKLFFPISMSVFATGLFYYSYTYLTSDRFTNMGAVLMLSSLIILLIGMLSEQISSLHYRNIE